MTEQIQPYESVHVNMYDRLCQIARCLDLYKLRRRESYVSCLHQKSVTHDILGFILESLPLSHLHQLVPLFPSLDVHLGGVLRNSLSPSPETTQSSC